VREAPAHSPLSFEEARQIVIETVRALPHLRALETVPLDQAHGRRIAEPLRADRDYPALRRSLRDGFAVRSSDLPGTLRTRGELRAGDHTEAALMAGEAIEIMTGAPIPEGADAVVMIEHVAVGNGTIHIERSAEPGQFINDRGAEVRADAQLITQGTKLDASHIAALASAGRSSLTVFARPRVAILSTGDEIVELGESPKPHQVRNSNSHMLAALVRSAGGEATILPIARDTRAALDPLLVQGLAYDMLVISGGVSAGKYDLVKPALRELGALFYFERVRIQPGQPATFATRAGKPVFGLPGNPGSSLVTFALFARAALELLAGDPEPVLPLLSARFEAPFRHKPGLTRFLPAQLSQDGQHLRHIPWQGSSDIPALASANCFLVADYDRESWEVGDSIRVLEKW